MSYGPVSWTVVDWPGPAKPPEKRKFAVHSVKLSLAADTFSQSQIAVEERLQRG
jgi:hypothetical protein